MNNVGNNGYDETTELVDLTVAGRLISEHQKGSKILMMMAILMVVMMMRIAEVDLILSGSMISEHRQGLISRERLPGVLLTALGVSQPYMQSW